MQDSAQLVTYRNDTYYFFGDTVCPKSARQDNCASTGMFSVGARAAMPHSGAKIGRETLVYIGTKQHTPQPIAPLPPITENSWLGGLMVTNRGDASQERFFGWVYKNPGDGVPLTLTLILILIV